MRTHASWPILLLVGGIATATPSQAALLFADNFNSNSPQLNTAPAGWTIANSGAVDIIGTCSSATEWDLFPGNGCYIDLDGSFGVAPGSLTNTVVLQAGLPATLSFALAGSQRGDANTVTASFGTASLQIITASADPFLSHSLAFTPATPGAYTFSFLNDGSGDDWGAVLDNVVVNQGPPAPTNAPGPLPLLGVAAAWSYSRRLRLRGASHGQGNRNLR